MLAALFSGIGLVSLPVAAAATQITITPTDAPYKDYEAGCASKQVLHPIHFRLRADLNFDGLEDFIIGSVDTCENRWCKADLYLHQADGSYGRVEYGPADLWLDPQKASLRQYGTKRGQLTLTRPSPAQPPEHDIWFVDASKLWPFRFATPAHDDMPEAMKVQNPGEPNLLIAEYSHCERGGLHWSSDVAKPRQQQ